MKKKEIIIVAAILIAAAALWAGLRLTKKEDLGSIRITVAGEEYGTYPLNEDQTIKIGETNVCEIKDGQVSMIEANCPDQICVHQPALTKDSLGLIVCLPNQVIIETVSDENSSGLDAVVQ